MFKRIAVAVLTVGGLALHAPVAQADPSPVECGYEGAPSTDEDATSTVLYGVIVGSPGEFVSLRCEIRVNGVTAVSTVDGTGRFVAVTYGVGTFWTSSAADDVDLCAVWSTSTSSGELCGDATTAQIPPQLVIDLLTLITSSVDPLVCPVLASLPPVTGLVEVSPEGDITLPEPIGKFWDCPPYDRE